MIFRILTLVLNVENDQIASGGLRELFRILTSILNIKDDQMALSGLGTFFRILTSVLNIEDDEPSSIRWSFLVLVIVSSGHG